MGFDLGFRFTRDHPEIFGNGRGIHDLPRIEYVIRIPHLFNLFHQLVVLFSQHKRDEFPTHTAVSMLTTHGTVVFFYQDGYFGHQLVEKFHIRRVLKIYQGTKVDLSRGNMGVVYLVKDPELDREVALKVLLGGESAHLDNVARFLREAKSTAKLEHPNIIKTYDIGQEGEKYYFTLEYIKGKSLDQLFREKKKFSLAKHRK